MFSLPWCKCCEGSIDIDKVFNCSQRIKLHGEQLSAAEHSLNIHVKKRVRLGLASI